MLRIALFGRYVGFSGIKRPTKEEYKDRIFTEKNADNFSTEALVMKIVHFAN